LIIAASHGHLTVVEYLISQKVDVNAVDKVFFFPLDLIECDTGMFLFYHLEILQFLSVVYL